jgi:hypothetical protein
MLKKSASIVLASLRGSTYRSVCLASSFAVALLDGLFEHPALFWHRRHYVGFQRWIVYEPSFPQLPMMTRLTVLIIAVLLTDVLFCLPGAAAGLDQKADAISVEDYGLYDQVVTSKFLTSATQLVVIERMTRLRFSPDQEEAATIGAFQEQRYFDGELPVDLIREFTAVNQHPSRLERRFHFGVGYRFATGDTLEEPEVSLARPVTVAHATPAQAPLVLDRLAFSRMARSLRNDHALLYVEILRPDGTGAGFFVWCRRQGQRWTLFDTEVIWTIQSHPDGGPLLAP